MMWPPTNGSNTISASGASRMCLSSSHQVPISAVKTWNARATGASTSTEVLTVVASMIGHGCPSGRCDRVSNAVSDRFQNASK